MNKNNDLLLIMIYDYENLSFYLQNLNWKSD